MREIHDYGEIEHALILEIFGDELTYNELKFYTRDKSATSYLTIEYLKPNFPEYIRINDAHVNLYKYEHTQLITAFIYGKKLLERKYCINHSCEMFNVLSNMKTINDAEYSDSDDEDDDEDEEPEAEEDDEPAEEQDDEDDADETSDEDDADEDEETEGIHEAETEADENPADDDEPIYKTDDDNQAEKEDKNGVALFYYYASLGNIN